MKKRTIAVDFDGTLCEDAFPYVGRPKPEVINFVKEAHKQGHYIIIWTCRTDNYLEDAITHLHKWGVPYDKINDNIGDRYKCRKVMASIYLDDKAVNVNDLESFNLDTMEFDNSDVLEDINSLLKHIAKLSIHAISYDLEEIQSIANKYGYHLKVKRNGMSVEVGELK